MSPHFYYNYARELSPDAKQVWAPVLGELGVWRM